MRREAVPTVAEDAPGKKGRATPAGLTGQAAAAPATHLLVSLNVLIYLAYFGFNPLARGLH
jgi:hypothetical protein